MQQETKNSIIAITIVLMIGASLFGTILAYNWSVNQPNTRKIPVFVNIEDTNTEKSGNFTVYVRITSGWIEQNFEFNCSYGSWAVKFSQRVFEDRSTLTIRISFSDIPMTVNRMFVLNEYTTRMDDGLGYGIIETVYYPSDLDHFSYFQRDSWYG